MEEGVKVLRVDEEIRFDDLGKPDEQMRVQFKVGTHGPFFRRFPKAGFTGYQVQAELEAFARELRILNGGV